MIDIVVGGGPGGSSAAGYLAMAGKKVLLIEKDVWPRDKICGDAVGGKSGHVKNLGVKTTLESTPHFHCRLESNFPHQKAIRFEVALPRKMFNGWKQNYSLTRLQI